MSTKPKSADLSGLPVALSRHAALKQREGQDILVLPERAMRLGGSGGEILRACNGKRSDAEIIQELNARFPDSDGLEIEVRRFLQEMLELGGLERSDHAKLQSARDAAEVSEIQSDPVLTPQANPGPLNLIAELTYRCPLQCPYCSNPINFKSYREALSADDWARVFTQAAELGVVHVGLTGGEPSARQDLEEILHSAVEADLYPHLVTAGLPLDAPRLEGLAERGLKSVQVSIQDATAAGSDRIAGTRSFSQKLALCEKTKSLDLALTLNCVLHRDNLDSVDQVIALAEQLGADRLELANTQYHGWALRNRAALMPDREQLRRASEVVKAADARRSERGETVPNVLFVMPDYFSDRPKPCMGGWGRLAMVVDPTGRLLPCHEAGELPNLEFWNVNERSVSDAWHSAPGMQAYRGTSWMPEPCQSCPDREKDFGGCRCQAFRLLGDASLTDPACALAPGHDEIISARDRRGAAFEPRR